MQKPNNMRLGLLMLWVLLLCPKLFAADHVILMSWDGAGSKYIESNKDLKNLIALKKHSYFTFTSRSEDPTITLPNHTSMVTGLPPAQHQVLWNKWEPDKGIIKLNTIFDLAKQAKLTTGLFVGKEKLQHFYKKEVVDQFYLGTSAEETSKYLMALIAQKKLPAFSFVHYSEPDVAGHDFGWGSPEQFVALKKCDESLGLIIAALKKAKLDSKTTIIFTADHGGLGKNHKNLDVPEVTNIPLLISSAKLKSAVQIKSPASNSRLAALVAKLLNLTPPKEWGWAPAPVY